MKFLNYFDACCYINLNSRIDRREEFESRIKLIGLNNIERYSAIQLKEEELKETSPFNDPRRHIKISCTLSHLNLIKKAKDNKWDSIFIFEDDCIFADNFLEKANKCIEDLKSQEWDLFYFGGELHAEPIKITENIYKCTVGLYGTHAYAIHSRFYDYILNLNPYLFQAVDSMYIHNMSNRIYLMSKELLCLQDDNSESDLWGGKIKREENYKRQYNKFIK